MCEKKKLLKRQKGSGTVEGEAFIYPVVIKSAKSVVIIIYVSHERCKIYNLHIQQNLQLVRAGCNLLAQVATCSCRLQLARAGYTCDKVVIKTTSYFTVNFWQFTIKQMYICELQHDRMLQVTSVSGMNHWVLLVSYHLTQAGQPRLNRCQLTTVCLLQWVFGA